MLTTLQPKRPRLPPPTNYPLSQQQIRPRTQIEAMPPCQRESQLVQQFDAAVRHPVFFTESLRKAPNGVRAGNGGSPVSEGYILEEGLKKEGFARL